MAHEFLRRKWRYFNYYFADFGLKFAFEKLLNEKRLPARESIELIPQNKYGQLSKSQYPKHLKRWFYSKTGFRLNLEKPETFAEKIQWLKLYDNSLLKTKLADKYEVRTWVEEKIGAEHLIPVLGIWSSFDEIDFTSLPNRFVLKCTHGSGCNLIVNNKDELDFDLIKTKFDFWMKLNYAFLDGFELQYKDIKPRILAEQYVETAQFDLPDYKIHCFNGNPRFIQVVSGRHFRPSENFYDIHWSPVEFKNKTFPLNLEEIPQPQQLQSMLEICSVLATDFPYVRVDLYLPNNTEILFGEMTFTPASGTSLWEPNEYNKILGNWIQLPKL